MALVKCRECKKEVSSEAKTCPHCGIESPAKAPPNGCLGIILLAIIVAGVWMWFSGGSDSQAEQTAAQNTLAVSASEYGETWPFTFDSGQLGCDRMAAYVEHDGIKYALNGVARGVAGMHPTEEVWKDAATPGLKVDIGPMIEKALSLCPQ